MICVSNVAYELELCNELTSVHPIFHVSLLKKCVGNPITIVPLQESGVKEYLSHEGILVEILDPASQEVEKQRSYLRESFED